MFEKEAEKYVIKKHHIDKTKLPVDFSLRCEFSDDFTDFQKGAEFGYNKANEWHYPSKGEYPKECEDVLCYCVDIKSCSIGHTIIGGDNKIRWWSSNRSEELKVYAWKEIVLPKESK